MKNQDLEPARSVLRPSLADRLGSVRLRAYPRPSAFDNDRVGSTTERPIACRNRKSLWSPGDSGRWVLAGSQSMGVLGGAFGTRGLGRPVGDLRARGQTESP